MKITDELLNMIKSRLTTNALQPVPASVAFDCDGCAGVCGGGCGNECIGSCGQTCNITCMAASGPDEVNKGW